MKLSALKPGQNAIIQAIDIGCPKIIRQRFLDLGFIRGASISVQNISPLGNPTAYLIHNTLISLRNEDAAYIEVQLI